MEDKFLKALAEVIDEEYEKEYAEWSELGKDFSPELDAKLLELAKLCDSRYAMRQKKLKRYHVLKRVAVFLLVFFSVNFAAIGTSQAYRQFVFDLFENDENNSITIYNDEVKEILSEWDDYYYPDYLPNGYQIIGAEDIPYKCFLVETETVGETILITEYPKGTSISYDTESSQISDIHINNSAGKRIAFADHTIIIYPVEEMFLEFSFDKEIPENEIVKIAESMKYIEK